jgi:hypothetical protein
VCHGIITVKSHIGSAKVRQFCRTFVVAFKMAADDSVQDKTISKTMESTEDKKLEEIVPLTLESILCE